jgi:hypothetical protein
MEPLSFKSLFQSNEKVKWISKQHHSTWVSLSLAQFLHLKIPHFFLFVDFVSTRSEQFSYCECFLFSFALFTLPQKNKNKNEHSNKWKKVIINILKNSTGKRDTHVDFGFYEFRNEESFRSVNVWSFNGRICEIERWCVIVNHRLTEKISASKFTCDITAISDNSVNSHFNKTSNFKRVVHDPVVNFEIQIVYGIHNVRLIQS